MTLDDAGLWKFSPELASDTDLVRCPGCEWSRPLVEWEETAVGCEDCGEHPAMRCPECGEAFDHVWADEFRVTRVTAK